MLCCSGEAMFDVGIKYRKSKNMTSGFGALGPTRANLTTIGRSMTGRTPKRSRTLS